MTQKRLFGISGAIATAALIGGLLAGCMEKDLYDPNYGKEPLPTLASISDLKHVAT